MITPELLRTLLRYEPDTGKLFWLKRDVSFFEDGEKTASHSCNCFNGQFAGKEAFTCVGGRGYKTGAIFGRPYLSHRVIYALYHGYWPGEIDHKNHNRSDNRIENLREVTHIENHKNRSLNSTNTSGFNGVSFNKRNKKWMARIRHEGESRYLGLFTDIASAIAARKAANIKYGYHENHGKAAA